MSECDRCGLEDPECQCFLYDLEKRVCALEERIDRTNEYILKLIEILQEK